MSIKAEHEMNILSQYIITWKDYILNSGKFKEIDDFMENIRTITKYERPDFYLKTNNNIIYILEHFEFDNSPVLKKGSVNKAEIAILRNKAKRTLNEEKNKNYLRQSLKTTSYENFCRNAINNFENHYNKIYSYQENLYNDGIADEKTIFKIGFLMEDVSPLSLISINDKGDILPVNIFNCKEFLDNFNEKTLVDFCLLITKNNSTLSLLTHNLDWSDVIDPSNVISPTPQHYIKYRYINNNSAIE